ncbi:recombinase family protein [Streptomyces sp. NPDC090493]|uniref:recombinase family protein n=1 Tax=Streptomyces sp. NPDC090493 TaxID=3365964 RepID=UPI0038088FB7
MDPAEARVVKLIADLVIDGVNGLTDLANELNNRGALTRNGKRWTPSNLCRRLKSGTFLGGGSSDASTGSRRATAQGSVAMGVLYTARVW